MKDKNEYWEDLISNIHGEVNDTKFRDENDSDYQWALELKGRLKKIFLWDSFNKEEAKIRLNYRINKKKNPIVDFSRTMWVRAAVILIAILSGALIHALMPKSIEAGYNEINVPLGQMTQIKLSDGSKVWLNSGSIFRYPSEFGNYSREVFIDGEAFMDIAKNKNKPFIVNMDKFSVRVFGTSFNVSAYSDDKVADVTLVNGSVLVESKDNSWSKYIVPGQSATIVNGKIDKVSNVNTDFYTSWKNGKIVFRKETLEEIAKKMERWYNVEIRFKDEGLKSLVFSGTFLKYKPVEQVLQSLSIMNNQIDFRLESRVGERNLVYVVKKSN